MPTWESTNAAVHHVNPMLIGSGIACIGPGMAEGGDRKRIRDAIYKRTLVQHGHAQSMESFAKMDQAVLSKRLSLCMSELQYVEQVYAVQASCLAISQFLVSFRPSVFVAQAIRRLARAFMNRLCTEPVAASSDPALIEAVKLLTGKDPAVSATVIFDTAHVIRQQRPENEVFVLCPHDAKRTSKVSSLHEMDNEVFRNAFKAFQSISRAEPGSPLFEAFDLDMIKGTNPLFNHITGLIYTNVACKIPRMEDLLLLIETTDGHHNMDKVFELQVTDENGALVHLLGPSFWAYMDFAIATCIWAQLPCLVEHRSFYLRRRALYTALDGENGRRNMRTELQEVLEAFFDRHPHLAKPSSRKVKSGPSPARQQVDLTEADIEEWATSPAKVLGTGSSPLSTLLGPIYC